MSRRVQTTEATGKTRKAIMALGVVVGLGGVILLAFAFTDYQPNPGVLFAGVATAVLGLLTWLFGAIGAWWHHG